MKVRCSMRAIALASVVLLGAIGSAIAADQWFVLGEKTSRPTIQARTITAEGEKWMKEDIKKVKLSVEGADVEITKVVLHWNNARDDTITNVGVVKSGGSTAEKDAPGHEATLTSAGGPVQDPQRCIAATLKVWGYD